MDIYKISKIIKQFNKIVIFGFSEIGLEIKESLSYFIGQRTIVFCDNNSLKWNNKDVISVESAVDQYSDAVFIVASLIHSGEMAGQLIRAGIQKQQIIEYIPERSRLKAEFENIQKKLLKMQPRKRLQFEVNMAEHCNLNCKYCNHFSPLARESYANYELFEKDLKRLSYLFKGESDRIILLGGEPLLNKEIIRFIDCVRQCFSDSKLIIITNGLLIPRMDDAFFECCRNKKVEIWITKYPINNVYENINDICERKKILWRYFNNAQVQKECTCFSLDLKGKQNCEVSFADCSEANECITLKDGKLYTCPTVAHIEHFNEYFGCSLTVDEMDGVDIYEAKSGKEILERLSRPIPFCRFCDISNRTYHHSWGISERKITEWI